jgi:predicted PilT family ATPase
LVLLALLVKTGQLAKLVLLGRPESRGLPVRTVLKEALDQLVLQVLLDFKEPLAKRDQLETLENRANRGKSALRVSLDKEDRLEPLERLGQLDLMEKRDLRDQQEPKARLDQLVRAASKELLAILAYKDHLELQVIKVQLDKLEKLVLRAQRAFWVKLDLLG